ncbi:MAG: glycosyltransferase family 39 protein [Myxococcota bacterium]|nr:glycosyltransferase family 39 protein [Myxococcota bacterium]
MSALTLLPLRSTEIRSCGVEHSTKIAVTFEPLSWTPPSRSTRAAVGTAVAVFLCLGAFSGSVQNSTDAIYAIVARDAANGNWLAPEIAGGPYLMKPPLYFWLCAVSLKLFGGFSELFALRFPSLLSAWVVVMIGGSISGRIGRSNRAWLAGILLILLSPTVFEFSRRIFMEETLAATMLLVLYGAIRARDEDNPRWLWLVGLGSAAAILTKSYGGGFAGLAVLSWLLIVGPRRWLLSRPFLGGVAVGLALILLYIAVMLRVAPDEFLHQNLLPFGLRSEEQFSWYRTGSFFYFTSPLDPSRIAPPGSAGITVLGPVLAAGIGFVGGWLALVFGSLAARRDASLGGLFLLLLYVGAGYLIWGSLSQQRLYYLVPFLPALSIGAATMLDRLLPSGLASTAVLAGLGGLLLVGHPRSFDPVLIDPEPALAELGQQTRGLLPEGVVIHRYNDFFAATEFYLDRRTVGMTPNPQLLADFGRILVLGERGIAVDASHATLRRLLLEATAEKPFFLVIGEDELRERIPGLERFLHRWAEASGWGSRRLLLLSSTPPPDGP